MKRWFLPGKFNPREIEKVPTWQRSSEGFKFYYRFMCNHSWTTKKSPTRRYARWTCKQIAEHIGVSERQVWRYRKYSLANHLLELVTPGNSGTTSKTGKAMAPVFEIPASAGMINWWKRVRGAMNVRLRLRKEKRHEKKDPTGSPGTPVASPRNRFHPRC